MGRNKIFSFQYSEPKFENPPPTLGNFCGFYHFMLFQRKEEKKKEKMRRKRRRNEIILFIKRVSQRSRHSTNQSNEKELVKLLRVIKFGIQLKLFHPCIAKSFWKILGYPFLILSSQHFLQLNPIISPWNKSFPI